MIWNCFNYLLLKLIFMTRKFKQCLLTIPSSSIRRTTASNTKTIEHKKGHGLRRWKSNSWFRTDIIMWDRLIGSNPSPLDNWIYICTDLLPLIIPNTITKMNENINIDSTIVGSVNMCILMTAVKTVESVS